MTLLIWIAIALILVIFGLSHVEKMWANVTAGKFAMALFVVLVLLAVAKTCGAR